MQFSDTANKTNGILQMIEWLCYGKYATISGDTDRLAFFTLLINNDLHWVGEEIQKVAGEWPFDDRNHTNFPVESYDFTTGQQDYGLDSDIKAVIKVEVRDATTEEYSDITYKSQKDWPENRFDQDTGDPSSYWFEGRSIVFDAINTTNYDKYRITYDRSMHLFETTDTTSEPGFAREFHQILVYRPVRTWAFLNNAENSKQSLIQLCDRMLGEPQYIPTGLYPQMLRFYQKQNKEFVPAIVRSKPSGGSWK
jgi:hypothetical protein